MIKKKYKKILVKHFKSTLGPQDDNEEPHPCVAHMYALHITETMNALQAMLKHQQQLLNLKQCHDMSRFCLQLIHRMTME